MCAGISSVMSCVLKRKTPRLLGRGVKSLSTFGVCYYLRKSRSRASEADNKYDYEGKQCGRYQKRLQQQGRRVRGRGDDGLRMIVAL
ncbi:MAG: hypothetical protein ACREO8_11980 [Luteimonas sp.]